jgi:hypothetical protein
LPSIFQQNSIHILYPLLSYLMLYDITDALSFSFPFQVSKS